MNANGTLRELERLLGLMKIQNCHFFIDLREEKADLHNVGTEHFNLASFN